MSSLVILFIAIIAVIIPFNEVHCAEYPSLDLNTILEFVQQQSQNTANRKERSQLVRQDSSDSSDSDSTSDDSFSDINDSEDTDNNRVARLRKEKIINLIEKVANEKNNRLQNDVRKIIHKEKPNHAQNNYVARNEKYDNTQRSKSIQTQVLEELLNRGIKNEERKKEPRADQPKKRLIPNPLTPNLFRNNLKNYNKHDDVSGLEDYSKVYIVLNPQAVRKSKNKNSLNELISKVLALSSLPSKKDYQSKKKPYHYKGFVVKDDHLPRRSNGRDSREMHSPGRDAYDDEYKHNRKGNAGSSGGRTAIPYIRHHGDIYERDD